MQKAIKFNKDISKLYLGNCLEIMPQFETDSIDAIVTDPPYGLKFMNNKWDASVPGVEIWQECLRILKPGAFAFVMSSPRQDVLSRMIINISDACFDTNFTSIYWAYNTGFPKAQNISRVLDKRACAKQTVIGHYQAPDGCKRDYKTHANGSQKVFKIERKKFQAEGRPIKAPATEEAKKFDGAYSGFQPKPAVEVVIVAMKPLSENTYVEQALKNGHGCTWLDDCRIPHNKESLGGGSEKCDGMKGKEGWDRPWRHDKKKEMEYCKRIRNNIKKSEAKGRFPANVLCEDDVLDDGIKRKSGGRTFKDKQREKSIFNAGSVHYTEMSPNEGSCSRYFSLDAWFAERIKLLPEEAQKTFPWLIVPKASKREKDRRCENLEGMLHFPSNNKSGNMLSSENNKPQKTNGNYHPTCKPLKLMSWLITLGSREGDIVLDPFMGSGTTPLAAKMTHRHYKGIELEKEFFDISVKRIDEAQQNMDKFL